MLVWERPEPPDRPVLAPLSRERIVRAAIQLADADGLVAVSLRKVAAVLDVGPMRLYGYIATKEELLDLMLNAVHAEIQPAGNDWRQVLRSVAEATHMVDSLKVAVLAALNIADESFTLRKRQQEIEGPLRKRVEKCVSMVEKALEQTN